MIFFSIFGIRVGFRYLETSHHVKKDSGSHSFAVDWCFQIEVIEVPELNLDAVSRTCDRAQHLLTASYSCTQTNTSFENTNLRSQPSHLSHNVLYSMASLRGNCWVSVKPKNGSCQTQKPIHPAEKAVLKKEMQANTHISVSLESLFQTIQGLGMSRALTL